MRPTEQNWIVDDPNARREAECSSLAHIELARRIESVLADEHRLSSGDLFALAEDSFGGTLAEGAFTPRDAYDAAELGLHLRLLRERVRLPEEPEAARDAIARIERIAARLPSQTRRTTEQNDFQQFSTPAPYAALCAWISEVGEGDRVLEPSAGTGAFCAFALAAGACVFANELSDWRADLLAVLLREGGQHPGQTLTRENADHLDAVLPSHVRADVVLMNPPFSATAGRLGHRRVPSVGTGHVLQALRRLDGGGRLVTVLSAAVQPGKPVHRAFFETVRREPFRLRADVEMSGAVYRPYGTSVRTRLLVVDRMAGPPDNQRSASERPESPVVGVVETIMEAVGIVAPLRQRV